MSNQGKQEVGGISPHISKRKGHMEPAERRKAADEADAKKAAQK